ncbi:hypothetical protein IW146_002620 [Coemansia sp. RSA 922]|nr:hypothetical protein GGI14_002850 [Coemansia sp. S680]KAJ2049438.1 hypothetical protein GGI08_005742 [Coemansia sp. S2]KAJ2073465.1 hypothetical protein GGH13_001981 [Coemansia sp. S155-1]KAJ2115031.1 hypothetical protein IW146_002620 [Coemansia sp. RSA 922]KAJ2341738.1 hypothetical protein GGH92_005681 [Coemansia sp. RSA 2673]
MPSFSIGKLVCGLACGVSHFVLLQSFGSVLFLLGSIIYSFWSSSMSGGHYGYTHELSWQEPFSYEAKVYASLSPDFPVNVSSSFFDTAQLLWHIQPQSVENRYPLLRHKAVVNVPSLHWSDPDLNQPLYAYIFIQEAGQFGPHPNMSDPRLVSSRIPIVQWEDVCPSKSSDIVISAACSEGRIPELKYEPGASWAIVLENHAYTWGNTPAHIPRASTPLLGRFYNPPLLRNDFTKSKPKSKPLTKLNDKGLATDEYPTTIDVEFELSGIRQGWVLARARLDGHMRPTLKTVQIKKPVPAPWDPTKSVMAKFTELAYSDGIIPLDAVKRLSVPLVLVFVLSQALIAASLSLVHILLHLGSMYVSRWTGVSRTTVAIMYIVTVFGSVQVLGSFGGHNIWMLLGLFNVIHIGVNMGDMEVAPLAALSRLFCALFWRQSSPSTSNQSSLQEQTPVATDKGASDPAAPKDVPLSHTNLVDPVVATRRSVDEVAMYYLYLPTIPTIVAAVVYYMLLPQEYSLSSLGYLREFSIGCIRIIQSVAWLPQILVNYKAKSGSLVPVPFVLHMLAYTVASTITYQLSGYSVFGELAAYSFPVYLSYVILFVQWIMYRKVKQD